ncbi:MAG: aromatic aminobenezylarsenical efflux permease ArsG family transporter, partial [bacterium]
MNFFDAGILSAAWLGILTSVSPCPLATNVAAVSFISKKIEHPFLVFLAGCFYTLGRMAAYAILGILIIRSIFSVPAIANFLQKNMSLLLGPILMITGGFLLDIFKFPSFGVSLSREHQSRLANAGAGGAFLLGILFALAFCPISAALFFGSLIPLTISHKGGVAFPFIYGIGTGLPVLFFAILMALGVTSLNRWLQYVGKWERTMRKITGWIFILVGLYYASIYTLKI